MGSRISRLSLSVTSDEFSGSLPQLESTEQREIGSGVHAAEKSEQTHSRLPSFHPASNTQPRENVLP